MDLAIIKPKYSREAGDINTFLKFKTIFPNGVEICNGRKFEATKLEFTKFRNHINQNGKRCKCPRFDKENQFDKIVREKNTQISNLHKEIKQRKISSKVSDEKRILAINKLKVISKNFKKLLENINSDKDIAKEKNIILDCLKN